MSASPKTSTLTPGCSLTAWLTEFVSIYILIIYFFLECINGRVMFYCMHVCTGDTYNIPRVTDCTRELNEWVYQGDRERLFKAQGRELPELVRRFTQDVYMCVYVQRGIALYGKEENYQSPFDHSAGVGKYSTGNYCASIRIFIVCDCRLY